MAGVIYSPAPEVALVAGRLIADHHLHLAGQPIVYVFREPAARSRGKIVLGKARRVTGLNAFLVALAASDGAIEDDGDEADHTFFVMEIARPQWDDAPTEARAALVDHELCHFGVDDETGQLSIRSHDLEEFNDVVRRHGVWRDDVAAFLGACATVD